MGHKNEASLLFEKAVTKRKLKMLAMPRVAVRCFKYENSNRRRER